MSMTDKFLQSQNVRCDFKLLEAVVLEHNKLGAKLREFREALIKAQENYQITARSSVLPAQAVCISHFYKLLTFDVSVSKTDLQGFIVTHDEGSNFWGQLFVLCSMSAPFCW